MEGVSLPHFVGVGFGEGSPELGPLLAGGFEEAELVDLSAEGVWGDLLAS